MAQEQKPKSGWLERRRQTKRSKQEKRARQIAEKRAHEGAGAERATHRWDASGGGGGV